MFASFAKRGYMNKVHKQDFKIVVFIAVALILSLLSVFAHEDKSKAEKGTISLEENLKSTSVKLISLAAILATILVLIAVFYKKKTGKAKVILFLGISVPIMVATIYSTSSTIYLNTLSEAKGPVHWHADFEVWGCGNKVNLVDPEGISNRIGSPVLHEHNDDRVHVEGVVVNNKGVSLHNFFHVIGGILTNNFISVPTNEGIMEKRNKDTCNGREAKLQVFVYKVKNPDKVKNWVYEQTKLINPEEHVLSPYSNVPPGDCIIIEFEQDKEKTDKICETYKVAIERGELKEST